MVLTYKTCSQDNICTKVHVLTLACGFAKLKNVLKICTAASYFLTLATIVTCALTLPYADVCNVCSCMSVPGEWGHYAKCEERRPCCYPGLHSFTPASQTGT